MMLNEIFRFSALALSGGHFDGTVWCNKAGKDFSTAKKDN